MSHAALGVMMACWRFRIRLALWLVVGSLCVVAAGVHAQPTRECSAWGEVGVQFSFSLDVEDWRLSGSLELTGADSTDVDGAVVRLLDQPYDRDELYDACEQSCSLDCGVGEACEDRCEDHCDQVVAESGPRVVLSLVDAGGDRRIWDVGGHDSYCERRISQLTLVAPLTNGAVLETRVGCSTGEDYFSSETQVRVFVLVTGDDILWEVLSGTGSSAQAMGRCLAFHLVDVGADGGLVTLTETQVTRWVEYERDSAADWQWFRDRCEVREATVVESQVFPLADWYQSCFRFEHGL